MSRPDTAIGGRYRLVAPIARGGMGTVWEAWDEKLHRRVAVKQLHPQPGLGPDEARMAGERAMREARITARLHHPHAVPVYDVVDHDGQPCLVMQYLEARSLQELLTERGPLSIAQVARIGREVASALDAAHRAGIVHRDVKPGNVLIDAEGSAKLTDFGISHALGDATLTSTGMVTGTPAYLAPEVARGAQSSAASDVFSLGSTLYTAIEGSSPFGSGDNAMATLHRAASGQLDPPQRSGPLTPILYRMLAVDPARRPSMREVARTLAGVDTRAAGAAASATTEQLAPAGAFDRTAAADPPPSSTVMLPPVAPGPPRPFGPGAAGPPPRRRHRTGLILGLLALGLILIGSAALLITQLGNSGSDSAGSSNSPPARTAPSTTHHSSKPASKSASSSSSPPPSTTRSTTSAPPPGNGGGDPGKAVQDYYALLPGNTDTAWNLLTKQYQHSHAGGRSSYDKFWGSMQSVSVSDARTTGPNAAEATIHYVYKDGRKSDEDTTFGFKKEQGELKIDRTDVVGTG